MRTTTYFAVLFCLGLVLFQGLVSPVAGAKRAFSRSVSQKQVLGLAKAQAHAQAQAQAQTQGQIQGQAKAQAQTQAHAQSQGQAKAQATRMTRVTLQDMGQAMRGTRAYGSVQLSSSGQYEFSDKSADWQNRPVAWGIYDTETGAGWTELSIVTSNEYSDQAQVYAAGYLEGSLTADYIWSFAESLVRNRYSGALKEKVYNFLAEHDTWVREQIQNYANDDQSEEGSYWYNVRLVMAQFDGLLEGYNARVSAEQQLTASELWLINDDGDILDIERALSRRRYSEFSLAQLVEFVNVQGHCSAFIKWTGDDLMASHTTWADYSELHRIFKSYTFQLEHASIRSESSAFSSYPGMIFSSDDFYMLDTGLLVMETTLNILDETLYAYVTPTGGLMTWVRNIVANRISTSAKEWAHTFARHNSGTYNDQWMIVDYNLFEAGATQLKENTLWVLEQIPGYVRSADQTHVLQRDSYWASYNRPYFQDINERSMFAHYEKKHGEMFSYQNCPRAKIFAREQGRIKTVEHMEWLMMYNKYQTDPVSKGCPGEAIAARFDLPPLPGADCSVSQIANGATDSKVTSAALMKKLKCMARYGPTFDDQTPFSWNDPVFVGQRPKGLPATYNFPWIEMRPKFVHVDGTSSSREQQPLSVEYACVP